jgi:integrase
MKGSIRRPRTANAAWGYRIDLGYDDSGQRRQQQVGGFRTKKEAEAAMSEALAGLHRGTYVAPTRQTVRQFLEAWIVTAKSELAISAWANYSEVLDRYVLPHLGGKLLADLSPMDIKKWHGDLLAHGRKNGEPLAVNSVKLAHRVLHRALADGVRWNVIANNPVSSVRLPKQPHTEMAVWTPEQAAEFIADVGDDRLAPLWTLALDTGMRRGELAGLRWIDIDLDRAVLTVSQQRTTANNQPVVAAPKARSQRQLHLATPTVDVLLAHREQQLAEKARLGPAWTDSGYVFVDEAGQPFHPQRLTKLFGMAIKRTGATKIRLHDLRHTMATTALAAGVHPKVVQDQLGHATISVTLDTYSHLPQAVRSESAAIIASALRPQTAPDAES